MPDSHYLKGLKFSLAIILGYFPVAVAFGISSTSQGFSVTQTCLFSLIIFAGASQFALLEILASGTSYIISAITAIAINLRHLLYSATLSPELTELKTDRKLMLGWGLTDEVFASAYSFLGSIPTAQRFAWVLGLETGAYGSWVLGTWVGAVSGDSINQHFAIIKPALEFAMPALFISLLLSILLPVKLNAITITVIAATGIAFTVARFTSVSAAIFSAVFIAPLFGLIFQRINQQEEQH